MSDWHAFLDPEDLVYIGQIDTKIEGLLDLPRHDVQTMTVAAGTFIPDGSMVTANASGHAVPAMIAPWTPEQRKAWEKYVSEHLTNVGGIKVRPGPVHPELTRSASTFKVGQLVRLNDKGREAVKQTGAQAPIEWSTVDALKDGGRITEVVHGGVRVYGVILSEEWMEAVS